MAILTSILLIVVVCSRSRAALIRPLGFNPGGFTSLGMLRGVVASVFSPLQPPCSIDTGLQRQGACPQWLLFHIFPYLPSPVSRSFVLAKWAVLR